MLVAAVDPTAPRPVLVLATATVLAVGGAGTRTRAPFLLGAGSVVVVTLAWLVRTAPWPVLVALGVVGVVLLLVGSAQERQRRQGADAPTWVARVRTMR